MMKFSREKELYLFHWVVGTQNVKIHLKLLICSFGLTICLEMIDSGQVSIGLKEMSEFFGEGGSKLRAPIRDEGIM